MVMLTNNQITNMANIFNKVTKDDEFEIMFNNYKHDNKLTLIKFMNILKYLKYRSDEEKLNLEHNTVLDVIFDYEINTIYRVSINGIKQINEFLNFVHQKSNHVIFSILLSQSEFVENENFKYIKKVKNQKDILDFDSFDIRVRKSSETEISEKEIKNILNLGLNSNSKIYFRYKNRLTLDIINNKNETLVVDLTTVQSISNVNEISSTPKTYELEIDYMCNKEKEKEKSFILLQKEMENIKKVLDSTDNVISKEESNQVIEAYKKIMFSNDYSNTTNLYSMKPVSIEVQHVVDKIPNKYSVTDKADGVYYQLFVYQKIIYLISNNLNIVKTKYTSKYINTIIEGELIYLTEDRKYIFMGFDCLYFNNIDQRNEIILRKRLSNITLFSKEINEIHEANIFDYT